MKNAFHLTACIVLCLINMHIHITAASGINSEEQRILDELKSQFIVEGKTVALDSSYLNSAENYMSLDGVEITDLQATIVISQIQAVKQILIDNKITDLKKIAKTYQDQILTLSRIAANELGLILTADMSSKTIIIKNAEGKIMFSTSKIIKNTGDDYTKTLALSGAVALLLAGAGIIATSKGLFLKD